jgi:hypothetical protein
MAVALLTAAVTGASAQDGERIITASAKLVIPAGQAYASARVPLPACPDARFLVRELVAAPEVLFGRTATDVVTLDYWAVSAAVYQVFSNGAVHSPLVAHGRGPAVARAGIAGGQPTLGSDAGVTAMLLGGVTATRRYEFGIHLSGVCGEPFTRP